MTSPVFVLADQHVRRFAELHPSAAAFWGLPTGRPLSDWTPAMHDALADLARDTLRQLDALLVTGDRDRRAALVMRERLGVELERYAAREHLRQVETLFAPPFFDKIVISLTPLGTRDETALLGDRLAAVPHALAGWRLCLERGITTGVVASKRLTRAVAAQLRATAGGDHGGESYAQQLIRRAAEGPGLPPGFEAAARAADAAYAETARWLDETYLAHATDEDAAGRDRFVREARAWLGGDIAPEEDFRWAWDELRRLENEMTQVARRVDDSVGLRDVTAWLDESPDAPAVVGERALVEWLQRTMEDAIDGLVGRAIELPDQLRRLEACIAPPGGAAAMYYSPPTEDWSRPGRTWYPTLGRTRFPLWREPTIAYHEGVPGHHLDLGTTRVLATRGELSRFASTLVLYSGYSEGWALYAERLMAELGFFADPAYELGHLAMQALRATRVIVDIGVHCGLRLPADSDVAPGEVLTCDVGLAFLLRHGWTSDEFLRSEFNRYVGWPGQASCYKLGERVWLGVRDRVRAAAGGQLDLIRFHSTALGLGPLPLPTFEQEAVRAYAGDAPVIG